MVWKNILDERPRNKSAIVQVYPLHNRYKEEEGLRTMGITIYREYLSWDEYIKHCDPVLFWWMYVEDFPFPFQPERSKLEGLCCEDINTIIESAGIIHSEYCEDDGHLEETCLKLEKIIYQHKMRCSEHCGKLTGDKGQE